MNSEGRLVLITGPQWVPRGYFQRHYEHVIRQLYAEGALFRLGAAEGIDAFAQELLAKLLVEGDAADRVTVYDKADKDGRKSPRFALVNGFASYPERDRAMARNCSTCVCVLPLYGGAVSGSLEPLFHIELDDGGDDERFVMRGKSEPWNREVIDQHIIPLYKQLYPERPDTN